MSTTNQEQPTRRGNLEGLRRDRTPRHSVPSKRIKKLHRETRSRLPLKVFARSLRDQSNDQDKDLARAWLANKKG